MGYSERSSSIRGSENLRATGSLHHSQNSSSESVRFHFHGVQLWIIVSVVRVIVALEVVTMVVVLVVIGGQETVVEIWSHPNGWVIQPEVEEDLNVSVEVVALPFELTYLVYTTPATAIKTTTIARPSFTLVLALLQRLINPAPSLESLCPHVCDSC